MSDLIDRQDAIYALRTHERKASKKWFDNQLDIEWNNAIDICCYDIEDLPSAQPERKRGRWIYGEDETGRDGWFCSECGHFEMWDYSADMKSAELNLPNYCPSCGAKMEVNDESD